MSNWEKWRDSNVKGGDTNVGKCPDCDEPWGTPRDSQRCICRKPMMIYIAPGQHIHIQCPVHGDVKIYGSSVTYSLNNPSEPLNFFE